LRLVSDDQHVGGMVRETRGQTRRWRARRFVTPRFVSVTRVARSWLPITVSVIVATTKARIVAPAEWDADPDAKVRTRPEASAVVIASAGVEPARVVSAPSTVVSAAVIAAARVGSGIAAPAAGIATARVRRGSRAAPERPEMSSTFYEPFAIPSPKLGHPNTGSHRARCHGGAFCCWLEERE